MTEKYSEAVAWAKQLFQPYVKGSVLDLREHEPSEVFFRFALRIVWLPDEKGGRFLYPDPSLVFLANEWERSAGAFRLLSDICAAHVFRSEPIPEHAKDFAGLLLSGQLDFPKRTKASKTYARNLFLLGAAETCRNDFGLALTRNDETMQRISACDAVSEALKSLGHHTIEPRAIKELFIHQSNARLRASADQIRKQASDIAKQFPELANEWAKSVNRKPTGTEKVPEPPS